MLATAGAILTKPAAAATPTVTAGAGSGKLTIASSIGGSGSLTEWQYQQKAESDATYGSWIIIPTITTIPTTLTYTVTGLTDGTKYHLQDACEERHRRWTVL